MKQDVCYHLNNLCETNGLDFGVINCAVEASTLSSRTTNWLAELWEPDIFVREHITNNDVLIVSIGGNDIALEPSLKTIVNMLALQVLNSVEEIEGDITKLWGATHFIEMFKEQVVDYVKKLVAKCVPKKIIICMIYFPDEADTGSWADFALSALNYNSNPRKLQASIEQIFLNATCEIKIDGTEVIPFPLFQFLDGKDSRDYIARVEPSSFGGEKIARGLLEYLR